MRKRLYIDNLLLYIDNLFQENKIIASQISVSVWVMAVLSCQVRIELAGVASVIREDKARIQL